MFRMNTSSDEQSELSRQERALARADGGAFPLQIPRSSGVLLHISSLPGPHGIGDLGPTAYEFADFLAETGQRLWQVLPLVPVGHGYSPYSSPSTFAGNPLFVSPILLVDDGLLEQEDLRDTPDFPAEHVEFAAVIPHKKRLLARAFDRFRRGVSKIEGSEFEKFREANAHWLSDYSLFMSLKSAYRNSAWTEWPQPLASREASALDQARSEYSDSMRQHEFSQFLFFQQWTRLRRYCNRRDIRFFGDLPIYVAHDSADVWAHRDLFFLDESGRSTVVAGVPPDYFSETGQRWGNPLYRWDVMRNRDYLWWTRRFGSMFNLVDLVRLDHFRAFAAFWEVPAAEETAVHGRWVQGPGASLFHEVETALGTLPLVAEDLGMITPDVTDLMQAFGFPGMAVLQFAFGGDAGHAFLPHNYRRNVIAYTGTHDNDTIVGWWKTMEESGAGAGPRATDFARKYLNLDESGDGVQWSCIRALMASAAQVVVIPLQDVLGLDRHARMNVPGHASGNWSWRYRGTDLTPESRAKLKTLTAIYGRSDQFDEVIT